MVNVEWRLIEELHLIKPRQPQLRQPAVGVRTSSMSGSMYVHLNIPKTQNFVLQLLDGSFENRPEKSMKVY